jgi:hypothetical protein
MCTLYLSVEPLIDGGVNIDLLSQDDLCVSTTGFGSDNEGGSETTPLYSL